ncbi:MAG: ABC transporter ATP-binding protein [Burkholderiales bacterium]|nr:ABC transporter ATP-binding protein [Burkholderiales bacterium]
MSADSDAAIVRAENVTKRFGALTAVDQVSYSLRRNEVAGIFGSNGAGKTTFFNLLTGYYVPEEGSIWYKGEDITRRPIQQRVAMGMMRTFQLTSTFDNLSVVDNLVLAFYRAHRSVSLWRMLFSTCRAHRNEPRVLAALETFDLGDQRDKEVRHLSLGEKRRLEIAMSMLAEPEVLLLDEPLAGLADSEIKSVLEVLGRQVGKQTIVIVEHKVSAVKEFVQRLLVMHEGRVIAEGGYDECMQHPEVRRSYWQIDARQRGDEQ